MLIDATVTLHRQDPGGPPAVTRIDVAAAEAALERIIGSARQAVGVVRTGSGELSDIVLRLPSPVPVRVLCTGDAADTGLLRYTRRPGHARVEVRVSDAELRELVVVDGAVAVVRALDGSGVRVTVVTAAEAARALDLLFTGAWSRGRDIADHLDLSPLLRTELARRILERLSAGSADELAAREVGVSLRTYRYYVAEIMRELDVKSRFQAGARAVELGLLSA